MISSHLRSWLILSGCMATGRRGFSMAGSGRDAFKGARAVFDAAVQSVQPEFMIQGALRVEGDVLKVGSREYRMQHNCYLVGFGKAVGGMAAQVEDIIGPHLVSGVVSIPEGAETIAGLGSTSVVKVMTGAKGNIPDEKAHEAAKRIVHLVSGLTKDDILLVLISGGGSALLPYPPAGISLEEKTRLIRLLSNSGATISELNTFRKKLSQVKGGRLAQLCSAPLISLILSDIVGDPLDLIASGPTTPNLDPPDAALQILRKYSLESSSAVIKHLQSLPQEQRTLPHVQNMIIGNNRTALECAGHVALQQGFTPVLLSDRVEGEASNIGSLYADLMLAAACDQSHIPNILRQLRIQPDLLDHFDFNQDFCLLLGGETTVTVKGDGLGGRNQELALACAIRFDGRTQDHLGCDLVVLSAGTDGYDGPTDAAGAVAFPGLVQKAKLVGLDAKSFIAKNDSYGFYSAVNSGNYLIKTGHTGTNVMDIHVLICKHNRPNVSKL